MKKPAVRPLDWLVYGAQRLGGPGLLGLALLLAALILDRFQTLPLETASAELEAQAQAQARQPRPTTSTPPSLTDSLPLNADAPEGVARLFAAAGHAGLSLEKGSYRRLAGGEGGPERDQITLPVSGEYPAVRAFLAEALERQPGLALDSLSLSRESLSNPLLEVTLGLTLYARGAP